MKRLVVLIYKRTHKGDPGKNGIFGIHNCMGRVRNRVYDAVIGIGGKSPWQGNENIAKKVNWIGRFPKKVYCRKNPKKPCVFFKKFCLLEESGPSVEVIAPKLFNYMYNGNRRTVMSTSLPYDVYEEVIKVLSIADDGKPSQKLDIECESKKTDETDFK